MGKRVWKPQRLSVTVTETFTVPPQRLERFADLLRGLFVATDGSGVSKREYLLELSEEIFLEAKHHQVILTIMSFVIIF